MQLYNCGFLQTTPENHTKQFWNAFRDALDSNIRGIDGKRRILSIIAVIIRFLIIQLLKYVIMHVLMV